MKTQKEIIEELFPVVPLPDFIKPWEVRAKAAEILRPPKRMPVHEAAEKFRFVNNPGGYVGPWTNKTAPAMVEPMEMVTDRNFDRVVFCGPAQSLKTECLVLNPIVHGITCDPLTTAVFQTTKAEARKFSRGRITNLIQDCPEVAKRLSPNRSDNNVHDKRFRGMDLLLGWPTINQLSGTPIPRVIFTDYDRMDEDIGSEGEPFDLGHKRGQSFGSRRVTIAESSPGRPILKAGWEVPANAPHEAPPTTGILALYNRGDRRRRYWFCPECDHPFEPRFNLLRYDDPALVGIEEAAQSTALVCPSCGGWMEHNSKNQMDRDGVWLKEGQTTDATREIFGEGKKSKIASFWLSGVAAALSTWEELVRNFLLAEEEYERTGSEDMLKTTLNVDQAEPWLSKALQDITVLNADTLKERAKKETYSLREIPEGVHFLTASVDVQQNRFEVKVEGWGSNGENWTIDYFQIFKSEDGERAIDPALYSEDWDQLVDEVVKKVYPFENDPSQGMTILITGIDMHGVPGASAQAYEFWRRAKRKGYGSRIRLLRGDKFLKDLRFRETYPDSQRKDRKAGARGEVPVLGLNSNRLKDEVFTSLRKEEPGAGYRHHSRELISKLPHSFFDQMVAEERKDGKWNKVASRNEVFDLSYYCRALWAYKNAHKIDWDKTLPAFAKLDSSNPHIVNIERDEDGNIRAEKKVVKRDLTSLLA